MKRVVQLIHSLDIGGAEVLAANLAMGLLAEGFDCSVWGMAGNGKLSKQLLNSGVRTGSFHCLNGVSPKAMLNIAFRIKRERVDTVVTHHFRQLFHAVPAAILTGTRLIHVEHDYHFYKDAPRYLPALRRLLRFTTDFVVISNELITEFRQGLGINSPCIAIPNGVDTARFQRRNEVRRTMRDQHAYDENCLVIGSCCRLEPVKQLDLLLKGFAQYLGRNDKARLVIVGDGSLSAELNQLARTLGILDQIVFAGVRSNIDEYLCMFDIYALTSANEGLPLAVLEAMSAELPIVSTDVGSLAAVVQTDTGILVQKHTPEAIADAFGSLENPATRKLLGESGRKKVMQLHSQESMVNAYYKILSAPLQSPLRCFFRPSA